MNKKMIIGLVSVILIIAGVIGLIMLVEDGTESTIFEEYTEMQSVEKNIFGQWYTAQTFTVGCIGDNSDHYIDYVSLYVSKVGMPNGNFTVSIRETTEKYPGMFVPVNVSLTTVNVHAVELSDVASNWTDFDFPDIELNTNTTYAIVCSAPDANETAFPRWHRVEDDGTYPCGSVCSSMDYGETWGLVLGDDYLFREYGYV